MILLMAAALAGAAPAGSVACAVDRPRLLAMGVDRFDQSDEGWRRIGEKHGCELAGAALVGDYTRAHAGSLTADQRAQLAWHEGQLLAMGGDRAGAIRMFAGITESEPAQRFYRRATLAFLRRDRSALLDARARLVTLPKPSGFDAAAAAFKRRFGQALTWPENLDVVDALIRCFDSDYGTAYADACPRTRTGGAKARR